MALLVIAMTISAGCTGTFLGSDKQQYIEAQAVDDVPDDAAVTSYNHESIADIEPIQEVVEKAANSDGSSATIEVTSAEAKEAKEALRSVPNYDGDPIGFYVRKGNQTYKIVFLKEE